MCVSSEFVISTTIPDGNFYMLARSSCVINTILAVPVICINVVLIGRMDICIRSKNVFIVM